MLDLLRLFIQVVEEQSFTALAKRLGISQPAVSNQMRVLEEKLGVKLLFKKGKGFSLTPQGELVYEHAKRMEEEWISLQNDLGGLTDDVSGRVHIGASHIPGEYLLPTKLAAILKDYPKIKFKITIGDSLDIAEKLLSQEIDFAVIGSNFDTEKLSSELWLKDNICLVIPDNHPLAVKEIINIEDLKDYSMILREQGSGHRRALEVALLSKGFNLEDFKVRHEVTSTEAVKNLIRSGMGYSFLSQSALNVYENGLKLCNLNDFKVERGFYLLTLRNKPLSLVASTCYRFLSHFND